MLVAADTCATLMRCKTHSREKRKNADVFKMGSVAPPLAASRYVAAAVKSGGGGGGRWTLSVLGKPAASGAVLGLTTYK